MKTKLILLFTIVLIPILLSAQNDSWYNKGLKATDPKLKIEYFTKSIEIEGTRAKTYISRGVTYSDLGEYDSAIADYSNAIKNDPEFADAYLCRGATYQYLGQNDKANADYNKAKDLESR